MKNTVIISKKTEYLSKADCDAIVSLHQQVFDIPAEDIILHIKKRTYVDLFYDRTRSQLLGTVGIQWYCSDDMVLVYVGNAVIDPNIQGNGLLTQSLVRAVIKVCFFFPLKRKFMLGCATSPKAYAYFTQYKYSWPKPFEVMPQEIHAVLGRFLSQYYPDAFQEHEHGYIIVPKGLRVKSKNKEKKITRFQESWFICSNMRYEEGYQIPCISSVNIRNILKLIYTVFHKKQNIKKKRFFVSFFSAVFRFRDLFYILLIIWMGFYHL